MQINPLNSRTAIFIQRPKSPETINPINQNNLRSANLDSITPQSHYAAVSQLVNSKYLFQLKKQVKKVLKGKQLQEFLSYEYSEEEFDSLPLSLKNLIQFDKSITTAEILQFMEAFDKSHEITFRDYNFDRIKFRALFEALGSLVDVEMQSGPNTYVPLSENFELKKSIRDFFKKWTTK